MTNPNDMGNFSQSERQITFIYYPDHKLAKEAMAYAKSANAKLREINLKKDRVTGTQWVDLAEKLGKKVSDFLEKEHPVFQEKFDKASNIDTEDAIKILQNHPELLVYPIATRGEKVIHVKMMTDILKLHKPD